MSDSEKYCRDCKHSTQQMSSMTMGYAWMCKHPSLGNDLVSGDPNTKSCSWMRAQPTHIMYPYRDINQLVEQKEVCGIPGNLFEVKDEKVS